MDDESLEELFRGSLSARAGDVSGDDPAARSAAARAGVRHRRRVGAALMVAAAVAVITPIAVVAVTRDGSTPPLATHPSSWRAESYNGIQLWVPPSWGWGMTPTLHGERIRQCGYGAYAASGSTGDVRYAKADAAPPYVGRPMTVGADCPAPPHPEVSHVWFDSPLAIGSTGTTTTISVHGLTSFRVTVSDADLAERRTILGSVQRVRTDAHGCLEEVPRLPWRQASLTARSTTTSVCMYYARMTSSAGGAASAGGFLFYSTELTVTSAALAASIERAGPGRAIQPLDLCVVREGLTAMVLILRAAEEQYAYDMPIGVCPGQSFTYRAGAEEHLVTETSVHLWAVDAVPLYAGRQSGRNLLTPYLPR